MDVNVKLVISAPPRLSRRHRRNEEFGEIGVLGLSADQGALVHQKVVHQQVVHPQVGWHGDHRHRHYHHLDHHQDRHRHRHRHRQHRLGLPGVPREWGRL